MRKVSEEHKRAVLAAIRKRWKERNPDKVKADRERQKANGNKARWQKAYYERNREEILAKEKTEESKEKHREYGRRYSRRMQIKNTDPERYENYLKEKAERIKAAGTKAGLARKRHTEETKHLYHTMRVTIHNHIKRYGATKCDRTVALLGIGFTDFMAYIETKFINGMSWSNYGEWELDHIKPVSSFDLTQENQQRLCFHHTNLQPLWKLDNRKKADKVMEI